MKLPRLSVVFRWNESSNPIVRRITPALFGLSLLAIWNALLWSTYQRSESSSSSLLGPNVGSLRYPGGVNLKYFPSVEYGIVWADYHLLLCCYRLH